MLNTRLTAFAAVIVAALFASPVSTGAQETNNAAPETKNKVAHFTLANGLELVVIPDHRTPIVTHMVWYRVGSADEQAGKSGIAHFLEHLMFKGTKKNPAGYFSQLIASVGGQENAFTSSDYTAYYQRVPREHLAKMMELEADRMTGLVLTDEVVLPERDVVLEEQNSRVANNPRARLGEQMDAALYLNHPYGRPVIGWRPEIEKLNREDALAFYQRFYGPNNAVLVVAGDVEPDQVRKPGGKYLRQDPAQLRNQAACAAAGTAAGRSALGDAGRSARRAAEHAAQLSRAVGDHRQTRRERSAGRAGAYSRRR